MNPTDTEIEKQIDHPWMGGAIRTVWQLLGEVWFPEPGIPQRQVMEP